MSAQEFKSIRKAYRPNLVILVVEDHMLFGKEIKHALPDHTVVLTRSIEEAKASYAKELPDLIFLDLDLPDGNGLELLDSIRAQEPSAYVIVVTGSKLAEDVEAARQKGARGYIVKPFTKVKIEQHIEKYLEDREEDIKSLLQQTEMHRKETKRKEEW